MKGNILRRNRLSKVQVSDMNHPELKSTVENPHPLFVHFVGAAKKFSEEKAAAVKMEKETA